MTKIEEVARAMMSKAGASLQKGLEKALTVDRGDQPSARIWHQGHSYVPESELQEVLRRYDERNQVAIEQGGNSRKATALELAGCKIALEQAWESNQERQAENDRLRAELDRANELLSSDELMERAVLSAIAIDRFNRIISGAVSEIQRLRTHYQSNSMLDHGRRQMLDHFEKILTGVECKN